MCWQVFKDTLKIQKRAQRRDRDLHHIQTLVETIYYFEIFNALSPIYIP